MAKETHKESEKILPNTGNVLKKSHLTLSCFMQPGRGLPFLLLKLEKGEQFKSREY